MNLNSKILKVIKESEEDENLFKPRHIDDRIDKLSPTEKIMLELKKGDKIKVFITKLNKFVEGKILDLEPEELDDDERGTWITSCNLNIKRKDVPFGKLFGIFQTIVWWEENNKRWVCRDNIFSPTKFEGRWFIRSGIRRKLDESEEDNLFKPRRTEERKNKKRLEIQNKLEEIGIDKLKNVWVVTLDDTFNAWNTHYFIRANGVNDAKRFLKNKYIISKGSKLKSIVNLLKSEFNQEGFFESLEGDFKDYTLSFINGRRNMITLVY